MIENKTTYKVLKLETYGFQTSTVIVCSIFEKAKLLYIDSFSADLENVEVSSRLGLLPQKHKAFWETFIALSQTSLHKI